MLVYHQCISAMESHVGNGTNTVLNWPTCSCSMSTQTKRRKVVPYVRLLCGWMHVIANMCQQCMHAELFRCILTWYMHICSWTHNTHLLNTCIYTMMNITGSWVCLYIDCVHANTMHMYMYTYIHTHKWENPSITHCATSIITLQYFGHTLTDFPTRTILNSTQSTASCTCMYIHEMQTTMYPKTDIVSITQSLSRQCHYLAGCIKTSDFWKPWLREEWW